MNTHHDLESFTGPEPGRHELNARSRYRFELARRDFFKLLGGGLLVLCTFDPARAQQSESGGGGRRGGGRVPNEIGAWLHIGEDGTVTVFTGKTEVGQNIRTSLTQAVVEELPVSISSVRLVMADTDLVPFDQGTFGSRTTPQMNAQLRRVAAAARETLLDLAAAHFNADRASLAITDGKIFHRDSGRVVSFGELTKGQRLTQTISESTPTKSPSEWTIAGSSVPKVGGRVFVTGRHKYTSDLKLPGMLHGKILRPVSYGATLANADTLAAESTAGVAVVRDGDFLGVAAPDARTATRALESILAEWKPKAEPQPSNAELFQHLKQHADAPGSSSSGGGGGGNRGANNTGSIEAGLADAAHKLSSTYTLAFIAHAPLEPRAAVAQWGEDGRLTVWTGTQRPFGVRSDLARALTIPEDRVRVIVPDTGSGYGGKHTGEAAIEAARLAKGAGKPVKLVWTREEEFVWAYFRPAGVIDIASGVRSDGTITAWEFHNYNSGPAAIATPYEIANQRVQFHPSRSPLSQGSYRGLASVANNFARESHMDDLAHAVRMDPLEFRLKNLRHERLRAVFEAAAKSFGWGRDKSGDGRGFGIAGGTDKGGYVVTCVEVTVDRARGGCGAIVNPEHLLNQVEGSVVMGLGGALFEVIEFGDGRIKNPGFANYRVPRFRDLPPMKTELLNRTDLAPAGAGESPIIGIAPAIGNAIFAATGVRLRALPLAPNGVLPESIHGGRQGTG
jgi:nicotinate dehydrogenase subunit B